MIYTIILFYTISYILNSLVVDESFLFVFQLRIVHHSLPQNKMCILFSLVLRYGRTRSAYAVLTALLKKNRR